MDSEIIRKISPRHICGAIKTIVAKKMDADKGPKTLPLFQVYGQATKTKRGESDNGPYVGLVGRFEAVCISDDSTSDNKQDAREGTVFAAPVCFLPAPMDEMIAQQLEAMEPVTDGDGNEVKDADGNTKMQRVNDSVEFAFEIGIKLAETSVGYEYTTKPIVDPSAADPLANLRSKVPALTSGDKSASPAKSGGKK